MYRKLTQIPETVYHGTTSEYNFQLFENINNINLAIGNPRADFGQGFYVTSVYEQALTFARYKTNYINRYNKYPDQYSKRPIIIEYKIKIDVLNNLRGKTLPIPDREWAEFIYNNRRRDTNVPLVSNIHNISNEYDYVYGHVADGKVARIAVEDKTNNFNAEHFLRMIAPMFPKANDQLSFHSGLAIQALQFVKVIEDEHYNFQRR